MLKKEIADMRRVLILASVLLSLLLAGCGAAWLLFAFWPQVLAWGYFGLSLLSATITLFGYRMLFGRRRMADPLLLDNTMMATRVGDTLFARIRFWGSVSMSVVSESIAWPSTLLSVGLSLVKQRKWLSKVGGLGFNASVGLNPPVTLEASIRSLIVIAASVMGYAFPPMLGFCLFLLAVFAVSTMFRHLSMLLNLGSLSKNLRSSLGNPYSRFLAIAGADLLTLILGFGFISAWQNGDSVSLDALRTTAVDMLTFAKLRDAVTEGALPTGFEALVCLAGGLYIFSGFKSAWKYPEFKRTAEDIHAIAAKHLLIGAPKKARWWLGTVGKPDANTYSLQAQAHLASGDFQKARRAAESAADESKVPPACKEREIGRILIAPTPALPWEKGVIKEFLRYWIFASHQDLFLPGIAEQWVQRGIATSEELLEAFDTEESRKRQALAYGVLLYRSFDPQSALDALRAYTLPDIGQIIRFCLAYRCIWMEQLGTGSEDMSALDACWDLNAPLFPDLTKGIETDFERLILIEWLYVVCDIGELHGLGHASEISGHANNLRDEISGNADVQLGLAAVDRIRGTRKRELTGLLQDLRREASQSPASTGSSA